MRVDVYADIVCPWCYIGERRFELALAEFDGRAKVVVAYRPFQLDPTAPAEGIPLRKYLERRYGRVAESMIARVGSIAEAEGIEVDWDNAVAANTRDAHRLLGLAEREYGTEIQRTLLNELFAGHFTHGIDISDRAELKRLAVGIGMDSRRVERYLASDEGLDELLADLGAAREFGIQSVPTFIFDGKYAVQGGQSTEVFLRVLEEVERLSKAA